MILKGKLLHINSKLTNSRLFITFIRKIDRYVTNNRRKIYFFFLNVYRDLKVEVFCVRILNSLPPVLHYKNYSALPCRI